MFKITNIKLALDIKSVVICAEPVVPDVPVDKVVLAFLPTISAFDPILGALTAFHNSVSFEEVSGCNQNRFLFHLMIISIYNRILRLKRQTCISSKVPGDRRHLQNNKYLFYHYLC